MSNRQMRRLRTAFKVTDLRFTARWVQARRQLQGREDGAIVVSTLPRYEGELVGPDQLRQEFNGTDAEVSWLTIGAPEELEFRRGSKSQMDLLLIYPTDRSNGPRDSPAWNSRRRVELRGKSANNRRQMKRTVYLILFRGVGGKTQLPAKALREKLTQAGFENVATYINSGNAIVRSRMNRKQVVATIAEVCRTQFDFDKAIFAPTLAEWDELIARNPFHQAAANAPTSVHAALLESAPKTEGVERVRSCAVEGEDIKVIERVAYVHTPHGFGRSKMAEKFDKWIGVTNTARNWNTVLKLAELGRLAEA